MTAADLWIAVPTYWTHPTTARGAETTVFDHPTPLDEDGTISRTLESFTALAGDFHVIVIAAGAHAGIGQRVHEKVLSLLQPFAGRLQMTLVSPANLAAINARLPEPLLRLDSYGNIRNVQLAVPYAMGARAVVAIDDDEVIPDADFLARARRHVGGRFGGVPVGGKAGPYFDAAGEYRIGGAEELGACGNIFLKKNHFMNEALKRAMADPAADLVPSNVAFGGDMVFPRATMARVCHDPYIPRGEDYDYVINAAMEGLAWFFQPDMRIVHLPPDSTGSQAADKLSKLVADIRRFIYMREKVATFRRRVNAGFDTRSLYPYPGPYLDAAVPLEEHAVRALDEKYPQYRRSRPPEDLAAEAVAVARAKAEEYFDYLGRWQKMMAGLGDCRALRETVQSMGVGRTQGGVRSIS